MHLKSMNEPWRSNDRNFVHVFGMRFCYILIGFFAFWQIPVLSGHALMVKGVHSKVEFLSALVTSVVRE